VSHNKSLLRTGGQWYLVCKSLAGMDKLPMFNLGEPPGAELSRYVANLTDAVSLSVDGWQPRL